MRRKLWMVSSFCCLVLSVLSLFTTIITYSSGGTSSAYNILDFISYDRFAKQVLSEYTGKAFRTVSDSAVVILAGIGIAAIVCAVIGILRMNMQTRNVFPFALTLIGLIGTAIPSLTILLCAALSQDFFRGTISCGIYPIVTPIAMIVCMVTVTRKRKKTLEELNAQERARGLIRQAGDL